MPVFQTPALSWLYSCFFTISRSLDLFPCLFLRLAVALGSESRALATLPLAPPRRWLWRARKVESPQPILVFWTRRLRTRSQSEACLFFCDSAGGGINIKHVGNALTSSYFGKIRKNALTPGIRRVSRSFSETESRCLDSSVALLPRSLTF